MDFKETWCYMSMWLWWSLYVKPMPSCYSSYDLGCNVNMMSMWIVMLGLYIGALSDKVLMVGDPYLCTPIWMCE